MSFCLRFVIFVEFRDAKIENSIEKEKCGMAQTGLLLASLRWKGLLFSDFCKKYFP